MQLFVVTTEKDLSLPSLLQAAKAQNVSTTVIFFPTLTFLNGEVCVGTKSFSLQDDDRLLIRWPWDPGDVKNEYTFFAKYLVDTYSEQVVLDRTTLSDFSPFYEDKLFQALTFTKLGVRTPKTWHFATKKDITFSSLQFPLVMKSRISSRGKMTYKISSASDLKRRIQHVKLTDIIFQEYIPFQHDLRILLYKGEVLGTVERMPHLRKNNRLTVKGGHTFSLNKKAVITDCLAYASFIGADFVGFDVLAGADGKYYMIEANLSPQYDKFEKRTGVAVSEKIVRDLIS